MTRQPHGRNCPDCRAWARMMLWILAIGVALAVILGVAL